MTRNEHLFKIIENKHWFVFKKYGFISSENLDILVGPQTLPIIYQTNKKENALVEVSGVLIQQQQEHYNNWA